MRKLSKNQLRPKKPVLIPDLKTAMRVSCLLDYGLVAETKGDPIPGQMCVESAVAYACGYDHNDQPQCVHKMVRNFKISLNDVDGGWKDEKSRGKGLKRVAIAQLGSNRINGKRFKKELIKEGMKAVLAHGFDKKFLDPEIRDRLVELMITGNRNVAIKNAPSSVKDALNEIVYVSNLIYFPRVMARFADELDIPKEPVMCVLAEVCVQVLKKLKSPGFKLCWEKERNQNEPTSIKARGAR